MLQRRHGSSLEGGSDKVPGIMRKSPFSLMPVLKVGFYAQEGDRYGVVEDFPPLSAFRWGNSLRHESCPLNVFVFIKVCPRHHLAMHSPDTRP